MPQAVDLPCRVCGKSMAYRGPQERRIIETWNHLADKPPRFTCSACRKADEERREREALQAAIRAERASLDAIRADLPGTLARCGVPDHWLTASFDLCPDLPPGLVDVARQWAENPHGLVYLYGPPGAGKTYLAVAMMRHVLDTGILPPASCRYVAERGFLDELKASFNPDASPVSPRLLPPSHPRRVPLLLYDDMGAARQTDWTRGEIATLFEARHASDMPTIITSNLDPDALGQAIDGRIASRVAESRMMLEFPRRDLRVNGTIGELRPTRMGGPDRQPTAPASPGKENLRKSGECA